MLIDCYGFESTETRYLRAKKHPCEVVSSGNYTYVRHGTDEVCPIHRIDRTSGVKILWAYGKWSERETLEYKLDLNTPFETGKGER